MRVPQFPLMRVRYAIPANATLLPKREGGERKERERVFQELPRSSGGAAQTPEVMHCNASSFFAFIPHSDMLRLNAANMGTGAVPHD